MKPLSLSLIYPFLFLFLWSLPAAVSAQTEPAPATANVEASEEAERWDQSRTQTEQQYSEGNLEEALNSAKETVAIADEVFGPADARTLESFLLQAQIESDLGLYEEANQTYQHTIELAQQGPGLEDPLTLNVVDRYADFLSWVGDFENAEALQRQVIDLSATALGAEAPQTLLRQRALALNLQSQGRFQEADELLTQTATQLQAVLGPEDPEVLETQSHRVRLLMQTGQLPQARELVEPLLQQQQFNYGDSAIPTLESQENLAEILRQQGEYEAAEARFQEMLQLAQAELGPEDPLTIQGKSHLAQLYEDTGRLDQALLLHQQVYDVEVALLGPDHPNVATDLNNIASVQRRIGKLAEAEQNFRRSLQVMSETLGDDSPQAISVSNNLALLLENQGIYDEAEPLYQKAHASADVVLGPDHPTTLALANNLAMLYESQGDFSRAELAYKQVNERNAAVLGPEHPSTLAGLNNLGYLYLRMERPAEALPLFQNAYRLWSDSLGEKHQNTLKALNNLGRVQMQLEDYENAELNLQAALEGRQEVFGERHPDTLRSMNDMGVLLGKQERTDEGVDLLRKTLELEKEVLGEAHPYTFETRNALADLLEQLGQLNDAFEIRRDGFAQRNTFFDRVLWVAGDNTRKGYISLHKPEQDAYIRNLLQLEDTELAARELLNVSLQRKGLLLKITSETQQIAKLSNDPKLAETAAGLLTARKELAALTLAGPTPENKDIFLQLVHNLEEQVNSLQLKIGEQSLRFRESRQTVSADQVLEALGDVALVDFLTYQDDMGDASLVAIVASGGSVQYHDYGTSDYITDMIMEYREVIQDFGMADEDVKLAGYDMWDVLWSPLTEALGESEALYLIPDGSLNVLPFDALVDDNDEYLIQSLDLRLISSARDLVLDPLAPATGEVVIVAGPDYDTDQILQSPQARAVTGKRSGSVAQGARMGSGLRGLSFDPLPGAEKEGSIIEAVSRDKERATQIFSKRDGEEEQLRSLPEVPEVLHIATHGFFLKEEERLAQRIAGLNRGSTNRVPPPGDNPLLRAGLAFAGLNANAPLLGEIDTDNDGVLTAMEVLSLDLVGTQLVVLSACETGLGEIHDGEGVYGLRRSFQEAGVRAVVNSFWEVSDDGTQHLMTEFYDRYLEGTSPRDALREARLEMVNDPRWSSPFYWSAFALVGRNS